MNRRVMLAIAAASLLAAGVTQADNALGLYFSSDEFSIDTAQAQTGPGVLYAAYIVLTGATGSSVAGYEVSISGTDPGFDISFFSPWENSGTDDNHLVHFLEPKPVVDGDAVLSTVFIGVATTEPSEIMFGPAVPSSIPGAMVVDFGGGDVQACSYPFPDDAPTVAWLSQETVDAGSVTLAAVKSMFR